MGLVKKAADLLFHKGYFVTVSLGNYPDCFVRYTTRQDRSDYMLGDGIDMGIGARVCDSKPEGGTFCRTYVGAWVLKKLCCLDWNNPDVNFAITPYKRDTTTSPTTYSPFIR